MTTSYWHNQSDPYQYKNSKILKNIPGIRDLAVFEAFEQRATTLRFEEAIAVLTEAQINLTLWKKIHYIIFQDVYRWAGKIRTVQLAKGSSVFAMPEHISAEAKRIFNELNKENIHSYKPNLFIERLAYYFGELNVLHPFREGNGRTQKLLFNEIARRAGYGITWSIIDEKALLKAVIIAFNKQDFSLIAKLFKKAVTPLLKTP